MNISTNRSTNSNPSNSVKGKVFEKNVQSAFSSYLPLKDIVFDFTNQEYKFYFCEIVVKILSEKIGLKNLEPIYSYQFRIDQEKEDEIYINNVSFLIKFQKNSLTLIQKNYNSETIININHKPIYICGYVWKLRKEEKFISLNIFDECKIILHI